ncbi:MAG: methanogenesis marker protein Mmp4/MtxX [ANME-2 cluster archaeon]|nr:methanogenesis marker protein Mmp4/MtxX [ANME-2 cluster archaeon]MDF1532757.1 methanogenesis marker protein Mmp4/MtxX [ANME-2 cluster archaeon]
MSGIISNIHKKAVENHARIALGIGRVTPKLLQSAVMAGEFADVLLVGDSRKINTIGTHLEVIHSDEPTRTLVELLASGDIDGAVRGTLSATSTLSYLKEILDMKNLYRIALLETPGGIPMFLAPVGIDEGSTREQKLEFIRRGVEHIRRFGIEPKVGILSGGRFEDRGRDPYVDQTLDDAEYVTTVAGDEGYDVKHYGILIEDAVGEADFILAPDGISGNLIFRTLVLVGGGYGYGAPVLMEKVFVDTSRVGGHYTKAIMMASALAMKKE